TAERELVGVVGEADGGGVDSGVVYEGEVGGGGEGIEQEVEGKSGTEKHEEEEEGEEEGWHGKMSPWAAEAERLGGWWCNPGHPISSGVTLAKLAAVTMDEQGNETFDTSGALDKLRKSLQLELLAMYHDLDSLPWNMDKKWEDLSPKEQIEVLQIEVQGNSLIREDTYQENNDICCPDYHPCIWEPKDPGHLFMLMFLDHVFGQQTCLARRSGFFCLICNVIFCLTVSDGAIEQSKSKECLLPGWNAYRNRIKLSLCLADGIIKSINCYYRQWDLLLRDYEEYTEDIEDICDNFEGLCQCNLAAKTVNQSPKVQSGFGLLWCSILNLASIQKIALKMISEGGVQGNLGILDLRKLLSDPKFLKLCTGLGRIYAVIHEQENWSYTMKKVLMADFEKSAAGRTYYMAAVERILFWAGVLDVFGCDTALGIRWLFLVLTSLHIWSVLCPVKS
ncbi:hypothetical protein POUND7_006345, partial [Theobroma cacao]